MAHIFVRKLAKHGESYDVGIPIEILRAFGWERGDNMLVRAERNGVLSITKFNPASVPDKIAEAQKPLPEIHA